MNNYTSLYLIFVYITQYSKCSLYKCSIYVYIDKKENMLFTKNKYIDTI